MQRSTSATLPCFPIAPKRCRTPARRQSCRKARAVNCFPRSVIRCRGACPAARIVLARKALIATAVGRPRKTRTPMIRREKWSTPTATQQQKGQGDRKNCLRFGRPGKTATVSVAPSAPNSGISTQYERNEPAQMIAA